MFHYLHHHTVGISLRYAFPLAGKTAKADYMRIFRDSLNQCSISITIPNALSGWSIKRSAAFPTSFNGMQCGHRISNQLFFRNQLHDFPQIALCDELHESRRIIPAVRILGLWLWIINGIDRRFIIRVGRKGCVLLLNSVICRDSRYAHRSSKTGKIGNGV